MLIFRWLMNSDIFITNAHNFISLGGLSITDVSFGEVVYEDELISTFDMDGIVGF